LLRLRRSIDLSLRINIQKLLEDSRSQFVFSCYQLFTECHGKSFEYAGGVTSYWPEATPASEATRFDIGSLTKVVVTTSLFSLGMAKGEFPLDSHVKQYLPTLGASWLGTLRIGELLSHSSGLKAWCPIYQELGTQTLLEWFASRSDSLRVGPTRGQAVYSDLNFLLLGLIWESKNERLGKAFEKRVRTPLGMTETSYGPVPAKDTAATEYSSLKKGPWQGEVFDANAAKLGSECGHAGLFSTARSLAPFCREWLAAVKGKSSWLPQEVACQMTGPSSLVAQSSWGYGWDTKSPEGSSAGSEFSSQSFGHLGYPGCSMWIDPEKEGFAIFFSNRIHPSRYDERIRILRPILHNAIAEEWKQSWKS